MAGFSDEERKLFSIQQQYVNDGKLTVDIKIDAQAFKESLDRAIFEGSAASQPIFNGLIACGKAANAALKPFTIFFESSGFKQFLRAVKRLSKLDKKLKRLAAGAGGNSRDRRRRRRAQARLSTFRMIFD